MSKTQLEVFEEILDRTKHLLGTDPEGVRAHVEKIFGSQLAGNAFHDRMVKEGRSFELPYTLLVLAGCDPVKSVGDVTGAAYIGGVVVGFDFAKALFIEGLMEITGEGDGATS